MFNKCLRSGCGGLIGGGLGTSFESTYGSKLGVIEGSVVRNMVGLAGG